MVVSNFIHGQLIQLWNFVNQAIHKYNATKNINKRT